MDAAPSSGPACAGRARRERDFRHSMDGPQPYTLNGPIQMGRRNEALHGREETRDQSHARALAHTYMHSSSELRGALTRGSAS
jgi:hypothetical protein